MAVWTAIDRGDETRRMSVHPVELSTRIIDSGVVDTPPNRVDPGAERARRRGRADRVVQPRRRRRHRRRARRLRLERGADRRRGGRGAARLVGRTGRHVGLHPRPRRPRRRVAGVRRRRRGDGPAGAARARPRARRATGSTGTSTPPGYNRVINMRQFGGAAVAASTARDTPFLPVRHAAPRRRRTTTQLTERIGDVDFEFRHCLGETDDHTWTWMPAAEDDQRRRPVHLELPELWQPAEGAAVSRSSGPSRCGRWRRWTPSCSCRPTASRSPAPDRIRTLSRNRRVDARDRWWRTWSTR